MDGLLYRIVEEARHQVDHRGTIVGRRAGQAEQVDEPEAIAHDPGQQAERRVETVVVHQPPLPRVEDLGGGTEFTIAGGGGGENRRGRIGLVLIGPAHVLEVGPSKRTPTVALRQLVEAGGRVGQRLLQQAGDEVFLRPEMVQEAALADPRLLRDPCEGHGLHAIAPHDRRGGTEQGSPRLGGTGLLRNRTIGHSERRLALPYASGMGPTPDATTLVPTVDISNPSATELAAVDQACRDHGFFLLVGHGADDLIASMWEMTAAFFAQGDAVKGPMRRDETNPMGYWDRELTKRKRDHKEVFDYLDPNLDTDIAKNRWPGDTWARSAEFRTTLNTFFDSFSTLATDTLGIIRSALGLSDEHTAAELGFVNARRSSTVRLNHYPVGDPVPEGERDGLADLGPTALGFHTDPGVLTLLLQDDVGGLQAESTTHGWIDVPPRAGAIVVNLGDAMQVWTNDQYKAAVHRVVEMTERSRYSIPYFSNPPRDARLAPLPAVMEAEGADARYRDFTWKEYIGGRMQDNFADYGVEDIQITDFRVGARA